MTNIFGIVTNVPTPLLELDWAAYADEIGRRVETARRAQSVSQTELAAVTGLSRTQIQNIERSRSSPKATALPAKAAKVSRSTNKPVPRPARKLSYGNATLLSLFAIAQALGVPPKMLIPDGVPKGDYRAQLDETWSAIEFEISSEISKHPLPPTTRPSPFVKPFTAHLVPTRADGDVQLTAADRAAIVAASASGINAPDDAEFGLPAPRSAASEHRAAKLEPPQPNEPTATGSLLRTPTPKKSGMVRHN